MAKMIPAIVPDFHRSRGEENAYRALKELPDTITVIHSFRWLHPGAHRKVFAETAAQGEGDFVLFDPARGLMVIEVKGGEVWCEQGEWRQRNRNTGKVEAIFPEDQARRTVHRIREELQAKIPEARSMLFCHVIWFPDGVADRDNLPMYCPSEIVLDEESVERPEEAIGRAFAYWRKALPNRAGIRSEYAAKVLDALAPSLSLVPSLRRSLNEREAQLVQLTQEQTRVVQFLDEQRHAAVHGAAGTGKTMIGLEKARRLASPADPVLFLCYNSALQAYLKMHHPHPNVRCLTFHGLARETMGNEGSLEEVEAALLDHLMMDGDLPYRHLIVDEGQDFRSDWLEFLAHRFREGVFYVFYDRNQLVQSGQLDWLEAVPCRLVLSRNCRNTDEIARAAYRAAGLAVSPTLGVRGPKPVLHCVESEEEALDLTRSLLKAACTRLKMAPHDLAVVTLDTLSEVSPWRDIRIGKVTLSSNPQEGCISLMTARRFKGLEASLIIIPDADIARADDTGWRRLLYVACSRARQAVHVMTRTREDELAPAVQAFSGSDKTRSSWRALARILGFRLGQGGCDDPFQ